MLNTKKFTYLSLAVVMGFGAIASSAATALSSPTVSLIQGSSVNPSIKTPQLLAQSDFNARVLTLVNAERKKVGAPPLQMNSRLSQAAQRHAKDMAKNKFLSHDGSDRSTMQTRIRDTGYAYKAIAENVAAGQPTPEAVVKSWLDSSGHRRNMLNPAYKEIGIGYATNSSSRYTHYWTQVFGTPR